MRDFEDRGNVRGPPIEYIRGLRRLSKCDVGPVVFCPLLQIGNNGSPAQMQRSLRHDAGNLSMAPIAGVRNTSEILRNLIE